MKKKIFNKKRNPKRRRNPKEIDMEQLEKMLRLEASRDIILDMLELIEQQINNSLPIVPNQDFVIQYATLSLLRKQFARRDIDQQTLLYWLSREGLIRL